MINLLVVLVENLSELTKHGVFLATQMSALIFRLLVHLYKLLL